MTTRIGVLSDSHGRAGVTGRAMAALRTAGAAQNSGHPRQPLISSGNSDNLTVKQSMPVETMDPSPKCLPCSMVLCIKS